MYGQYIEPKFEALGLMFRLEKTASRLMIRLLQSINLEYITAKTLRRISDVLALFKEGLELDGIYNQGFNSNIDMFQYSLASPSFSLDQYINIFQFMAGDIKQIIGEYFIDLYERPLKEIIPQVFPVVGTFSEAEKKQYSQMESEKFFRENLSSAFLVQDLDNFITNIISTLRNMVESYSDEFIKNVMTYDPDLILSPLNRETLEMDNPVFLGAKAYFLKKLISHGFRVPPGLCADDGGFPPQGHGNHSSLYEPGTGSEYRSRHRRDRKTYRPEIRQSEKSAAVFRPFRFLLSRCPVQ